MTKLVRSIGSYSTFEGVFLELEFIGDLGPIFGAYHSSSSIVEIGSHVFMDAKYSSKFTCLLTTIFPSLR